MCPSTKAWQKTFASSLTLTHSPPTWCPTTVITKRRDTQFFERLYTFYTNTISNPFYVQDKKIVSQSFDRDVINACYLFSK